MPSGMGAWWRSRPPRLNSIAAGASASRPRWAAPDSHAAPLKLLTKAAVHTTAHLTRPPATQLHTGAAGNLPDASAEAGAQRVLHLAEEAGEGDVLLVLISGGGSALLPLPAPPLCLADKLAATKVGACVPPPRRASRLLDVSRAVPRSAARRSRTRGPR